VVSRVAAEVFAVFFSLAGEGEGGGVSGVAAGAGSDIFADACGAGAVESGARWLKILPTVTTATKINPKTTA
jgi:hypothetical protein